MPSLVRKRCSFLLCGGLVLAFASELLGQNAEPQGGEYSLSGAVIGDQTNPQIAISASGGYIVWQDNAIDGDNLGIAARRLSASLSPSLGAFRVNKTVAGWQENPNVALMRNGAAAIVWQGGKQGSQNVFLRIINTNGTFTTDTDVQVSKYTNGEQTCPVIACITNGNLAIAWTSFRQDGSMNGIYARVRHRNGTFVTEPFQVNQFAQNNQRNPAMAALSNGNFVVVWVSEVQAASALIGRLKNQIHIYGRVFTKGGLAVGNEFRVNTDLNVCAAPSVASTRDGGFTVVWTQRSDVRTNNWDIYCRSFSTTGESSNPASCVNETTYGDQYLPRISTLGAQQLVVWTSMGQDRSMEGIYGRLLTSGELNGPEFRVNSVTNRTQRLPAVSGDGRNRYVTAWSSYMAGSSFNIQAQRYSVGQPPLPAPEAPIVTALSQSQLGVIWPEVAGLTVQHYDLFIDGSPTAVSVIDSRYVAEGLEAGSVHSFQLAYVLTDGRGSDKSVAASGTTWGADLKGAAGGPDGLPDDWQGLYWGSKWSGWTGRNADDDGDGASNWQEFLAGTDPTDPNSVLRTTLTKSPLGRHLNWNTRVASTYQVQVSTNLIDWQNIGAPRRAVAPADAMLVDDGSTTAFYRVVRLQ